MTLRNPHDCRRCGRTIEPGDVFSALDVLDAEGELRALLCADCGRALRAFVAGGSREGDGEAEGEGSAADPGRDP